MFSIKPTSFEDDVHKPPLSTPLIEALPMEAQSVFKLRLSKRKIWTVRIFVYNLTEYSAIWVWRNMTSKGRGKIWRHQSFNNFSYHIARFHFIYSIQNCNKISWPCYDKKQIYAIKIWREFINQGLLFQCLVFLFNQLTPELFILI